MTSLRRSAVLACAAVLVSTIAVVAPVSAATLTMYWQLPGGKQYVIGVDHVLSNGSSPGGYEKVYEYPTSLYNNNTVLPNPVSVSTGTGVTQVRFEFYQAPLGQSWDPNDGDGAIALRLNPGTVPNVGALSFPTSGQGNAGAFSGRVLSRTAVPNGRVHMDIFQTTGQPLSSGGYAMDAFSSINSVGGNYRTGPLWNGQYIAFITDNATGRGVVGLIDLSGNTTLDLDLDMVCFGIDECQWSGSIPDATGEFHALPPTRIVDSRLNLGVIGKVAPGDGRNSDPNNFHRMDSRLNHEFKVAGVGGVPAVGVSAVLLNVTVTAGSSGGSLRLFPKPPRSSVWQDQSSYPASNTQAAALWWNTGEQRASLQLVEVGVGGRIRLDNVSFGDVHVIADVVGWVDQGQPGQDGSRLQTVTPARFLDTRNGIGGPTEKFGTTETRELDVAGRDGIPTDAESVVGTLTSVRTDGRSFQTAWPSGVSMPTASVLNTIGGQVRPNMVAIAPGSNGRWALYNNEFATDLIFDAVGYFTPAAGSTGKITALPSASVFGPTTLASGEDRAITVTGKGGVPASGVSAVWVLITSKSGSAQGYITAYRDGVPRPNASNLNWIAGQSVANLALVQVPSNGVIRLFNGSGSAQISVSVVGWVN